MDFGIIESKKKFQIYYFSSNKKIKYDAFALYLINDRTGFVLEKNLNLYFLNGLMLDKYVYYLRGWNMPFLKVLVYYTDYESFLCYCHLPPDTIIRERDLDDNVVSEMSFADWSKKAKWLKN